MEIRNRDDAQFILRQRVAKEVGRRWKNIIKLLVISAAPVVFYSLCTILFYPEDSALSTGAAGGLIVLVFWLLIPAGVAMVGIEKDKELLIKKYMDEMTEAGEIDKEEK